MLPPLSEAGAWKEQQKAVISLKPFIGESGPQRSVNSPGYLLPDCLADQRAGKALSVLAGSEQQELLLPNSSVSPAALVLIQLLLIPGQTQTPCEGKQRPVLDSEIKTQTHRTWHIPGTAAQIF